MSSPKDLQIYFLPIIAPGHLLPMLDMALSFSHHTPNISLLIPPSSSSLLPPLLPSPLRLIVLETDTPSPSPSTPASSVSAASLEATLTSLFDPLRRRPPFCLVFDMFLPFAAECARARNVPSLVFHGTSFFSLCVSERIAFTIECASARDDDDNRPFVVPGLPDSIVLRPSQVPRASAAPLVKRLRQSNALSYGAVFNSFYVLEPTYAEH
ncbi:UDP-glucose flavonoid 3-O-glucosyltransferase 7 [Acorus calamus]|uniref:UDP-glucose flavonoid 3-O-glucosyltransferase 7 n=1 Tax=Acorus calamus TaxID=4465 RepID=A0AAV9EDH8_ACOCL|nr:UDP-glucose flavonoid 3-O-glucosyltransferase 7 [Acorus calamus]